METLQTSCDPAYPQDWDPNPNNLPDGDQHLDTIEFTGQSPIDPDCPVDRRICQEPPPVPPPNNARVVLPLDLSPDTNWRDRLENARESLPIPQVWEMLGLEGTPMSSCHSPFRRDLKASFGITPDGQRWKDFGIDDGGDVFDLLATALGIPLGDAMHLGVQIAESGVLPPGVTPGSYASKRQDEVLKEKDQQRKSWPPMTAPTDEELQIIADLRGLSVEGLRLAVEDGILVTTTWYRDRAWCVRSACGRNCQARLLTGKPWGIIDGKAKTLPGSVASTPIGLPTDRPIIVLCEGGPDMLAAYCCIHDLGLRNQVGVVGMMGTSCNFQPESLEYMRGKRVRIFVHKDQGKAGEKAALKWATQLRSVGADVDGFEFDDVKREDGNFVKDLNDLVGTPRGPLEQSHINSAFTFKN
jgi:hypothetical protein